MRNGTMALSCSLNTKFVCGSVANTTIGMMVIEMVFTLQIKQDSSYSNSNSEFNS